MVRKSKRLGYRLIEKIPMNNLYFDGLCEPYNPGGHGTYGYYIEAESGCYAGRGYLGRGPDITNNVAEYTSLIKGLEKLLELNIKDRVTVYGDSQLAIRQMNGDYAVNSPRIIPLYEEACDLSDEFHDIAFEWLERERNLKADMQSRLAYYLIDKDKAIGVLNSYKIETINNSYRLTGPKDKTWIVYEGKDLSYSCNCPAFEYSGKRVGKCKHCLAILLKNHPEYLV